MDRRALAATLPDEPRWIETRWLLGSADAELTAGAAGEGVVVSRYHASAAVVGRPAAALVRAALAAAPADVELTVQMDGLAEAQEALPGWTTAIVVVHALSRPWPAGAAAEPGVVVGDLAAVRAWLEQLPADLRDETADARTLAVRVVDRATVAVCTAVVLTGTLWDVGIDTLAGHRRRGHASACFRALAAYMAGEGRQPVWAAYSDYEPSLRLAARLGFTPVGRVAILSPPAAGS